jgi:hypothetical protein
MRKTINEFLQSLAYLYTYMNNVKNQLKKPNISLDEYEKKTEELFKHIEFFGSLIKHYNNKFLNIKDAMTDLINFADHLDKYGAYALADKVTEVACLIKTAYIPKMKDEIKTDEVLEKLPPNKASLSSRYCPDHVGVQVFRIADDSVQCPIDGKVYNYFNGYVNYKGQQVQGGSVKNQTPNSTNYGGVPAQVFDSKVNILNTMN